MERFVAKLAVSILLALLILTERASGQCIDGCACFPFSAPVTMDCTPRPDLTGIDTLFTYIPAGAATTITRIIMTGNNISTITPTNFSAYPVLETLVLNDNQLTNIPRGALDNLPQLTNLTLDGNPLVMIDDGAFGNLTALEQLSFRRTTLSTINGSSFEGLDSLLGLYIEDNGQLENLPVDFLTHIPQLQTLSLAGNILQTLPDGILSPLNPTTAQINLAGNPLSCDCFLLWLGEYISTNAVALVNDASTLCLWPPPHINQPLSSISTTTGFQCAAPLLSREPQNATLLSNQTLVIRCQVTSGAPFPDVIWTRDGVVVNLTDRVFLPRFSGSLTFDRLLLEDSGEYACYVENVNGTAQSGSGFITILEHTCFDEILTFHETDVDCGGDFCDPCNITQGCLRNKDCIGDLVCLHAHDLPSSLLYISATNPIAFTCANPDVPQTLLEDILQSELPSDIFAANVSGNDTSPELVNSIHNLLVTQLGISRSSITNVRISTVAKSMRPLVQVWFDLAKTREGERGRTRLVQQVDSGSLKATVRIKEESGSVYSVRLNL